MYTATPQAASRVGLEDDLRRDAADGEAEVRVHHRHGDVADIDDVWVIGVVDGIVARAGRDVDLAERLTRGDGDGHAGLFHAADHGPALDHHGDFHLVAKTDGNAPAHLSPGRLRRCNAASGDANGYRASNCDSSHGLPHGWMPRKTPFLAQETRKRPLLALIRAVRLS